MTTKMITAKICAIDISVTSFSIFFGNLFFPKSSVIVAPPPKKHHRHFFGGVSAFIHFKYSVAPVQRLIRDRPILHNEAVLQGSLRVPAPSVHNASPAVPQP